MAPQVSYLEEMAVLLKNLVEKILLESEKIIFTGESTVERKDLIEYDRRMRASGTDKFNYPAFVAAVNYYRNEREKMQHNACGALILYIRASAVDSILKNMGIRKYDDENEEEVAGKCADICLSLAEKFNKELMGAGYRELVLSQAIGAKNSIMQGVEFSYDQYDRYEIGFSQSKEKVMVLDLTMTAIPRSY